MKTRTGAGMLALAFLLSACGSGGESNTVNPAKGPDSLTRIAAPNNGDWTQTVARTAEGWIMGNPNAPTKLVEYASITCPHCAEFSEQAGQRLRQYVATGQVSWEYRPFLIFPTDAGGFALLRCQSPEAFFAVSDHLYATQDEWIQRFQGMTQAQQAQAQQLPREQQAAFFARAAGLDEVFRQRGMPSAQVDQCLADRADLQTIATITERASREEGITGTPGFLINGTLIPGADTWQKLEPALQARLGG
jgi:protein-disulfide isomerase